MIIKKCKVNNCGNICYVRGYCSKHYSQLMRCGKIFNRTTHDKNEIKIYKNFAEIFIYNIKSEKIGSFKIDIEDIDKIKHFKWCFDKDKYVRTVFNKQNIKLHRFLMNPPIDIEIDHKNNQKNDNRKQNLRFVTSSQNSMNSIMRRDNTSGHKGITWHKEKKKWMAGIGINKKFIFLGYFTNKQDAINVRRKSEKEYFGKFAFNQDN